MGNLTSMIRDHFTLEVAPAVAVIGVFFLIYFVVLLPIIGCESACKCCANFCSLIDACCSCNGGTDDETTARSCKNCVQLCPCKGGDEETAANCSSCCKKCDKSCPCKDGCCQRFCKLHYRLWEFCVITIFKNAVTKRVKRANRREEVLLFAEIEPDNRFCCDCCCTRSSFVIAYFVAMLFWASVWFWVMFWDNFYYSKLTRCADVNMEDNSITCYYTSDYSQADCQKLRVQNPDVICYGYNRGKFFTAGGIAVSVASFVVFASQICFTTVLYCFHKNQTCTRSGIIVLQVIMIVLVTIFLVVWSVISNTVSPIPLSGWNYFYAHEPLRWTQFALLCCTLLSAILVPTCAFTQKDTRYLDSVEAVALDSPCSPATSSTTVNSIASTSEDLASHSTSSSTEKVPLRPLRGDSDNQSPT